jgi:hypothetical protein
VYLRSFGREIFKRPEGTTFFLGFIDLVDNFHIIYIVFLTCTEKYQKKLKTVKKKGIGKRDSHPI